MTAPTSDALASALPADVQMISLDGIERDHQRRIGQFQAERLAEAGYALVHTAPDEATVERLARAARPTLFAGRPDDQVGPGTRYERNETRMRVTRILAALADTSAQARHIAGDATGGGGDG